jgi:hypothetical protein
MWYKTKLCENSYKKRFILIHDTIQILVETDISLTVLCLTITFKVM